MLCLQLCMGISPRRFAETGPLPARPYTGVNHTHAAGADAAAFRRDVVAAFESPALHFVVRPARCRQPCHQIAFQPLIVELNGHRMTWPQHLLGSSSRE